MIIRPFSLYISVKNEIEKLINSSEFKPGDKLPSEFEMAKKYNVSRLTLREALRSLEEEGLLARKQGVGTFIKATSPRIKSILDINYGVTEMIWNMGYHPGTKKIKIGEISADPNTAKLFNINKDSKLISIERIRTADETPVVYSLDMIPSWVLPNFNDLGAMGESVYDFLETKCNVVFSSSMARLVPTKANRKLATNLNIKVASPLLHLVQVDTDQVGRPVVYSREYFVNDYFDFVIYRKRKK
jgi:GntR family transcriptional regulator